MKIGHRYVVEAILFVSYVLFAMAWVGGTASMNEIMTLMAVDGLAAASFLSGAVTLAKISGTFAAAYVAIKLGMKKAFFVAAILVSIGILTTIAPDYEWLLLSRFIMGLGGALMVVYLNPIVLHWFDAKQRPMINGLNAVAFNIGTAIVLWFMPQINHFSGGWQTSLQIFALASFCLAILWLFVKFDHSHSNATPIPSGQQPYSYRDGLSDRFNWVYALSYGGLLAFYICLFTFYPQAGIAHSKWVIGAGIVGTVAGIYYSQRVSLRVPVIRWSGLAIIISIIGLSFVEQSTVVLVSSISLGFFIFLPMTALITLPQELPQMNTQRLTVVFSLFWSISYLFATVVLWGFGKLVDLNQGDFGPSFIFITVVSSSFFIGSFWLPETGQHNPPATQTIIGKLTEEK